MPAPRTDLTFTGYDGAELTASTWPSTGVGDLPVLLLHGLSQQRLFWGPVISQMRRGPVASLDQRGHGASDTPVTADYSVLACARDAIACLAALGWSRAVLVGHSWGGSVALAAAALAPDAVAAAVLIDGGLWSPSGMGSREEIRARLTPPRLGLPPDELWSRIRSGDLGPRWSAELQQALEPTFRTDDQGLLHSRLGLERHMLVLEGLFDVDPEQDLAATEQARTAVWAAVCEEQGSRDPSVQPWQTLKQDAIENASRHANVLIHRWGGAIHDVPLQWPELVAGFIDTAVATCAAEGGEG